MPVEADQNQRPEDQSALVEQSVEELDVMGGAQQQDQDKVLEKAQSKDW